MDEGNVGLLNLASMSSADMADNLAIVRRSGNRLDSPPKVAMWFLPFVDHALKGGVRTAFMLAEELTRRFGTLNIFVVVSYGSDHADTSQLSVSLSRHFSDLHFVVQSFRLLKDDPDELQQSDLCVATLWTTAYLQVRYQKTCAKFYLVQDFEPAFYPAGDVYAVIEQTYRFEFAVLANSRGVADKLRSYSTDVTEFLPGVDHDLFYPDERKKAPRKPFRIVFYGRPGNPRNCFMTGLRTLRAVKRKAGDAVEILSVGAPWDEAEYEVAGIIENLGLLNSMEEVAELYRSADLGLVYMMTPHPSYQPLEYMASGCVVATNVNPANRWLLSEENSLQLSPLADVASNDIVSLMGNHAEWLNKRAFATETIQYYHWQSAIRAVLDRVLLPTQAGNRN